jgi:hypothetical protein
MHLFRFEHRGEPVAPRHVFAVRLLRHSGLALAIIAGFVVVGAAIYYFFLRPDDSAWIAIHRASMVLFGMGPVDAPKPGSETVFTDIYALLSVVLPLVVGMLLAPPVIHRVIHHLHRASDENSVAPNQSVAGKR